MPGDLNVITVHGKYEDMTGAAMSGVITFTPSTTVLDPTSDLIFVPKLLTATLAGDGSFSINLPATDDPDVSPIGWSYKVTENFSGNSVAGRTFNINVPVTSPGGSVSLASLAPTAPSTGAPNYVLLADFNTTIAGLSATYLSVGQTRIDVSGRYADDIAAAITAEGGGKIYELTKALYSPAAPISVNSLNNVTIRAAAQHGGDRTDTPPVEIRFAASGTTPQLTAKHTEGFTLDGVAVRASSSSFTGRLIDVSGTGGALSYRPTFRRCLLGGTGGAAVTAAYVLDLGNTVEPTLEETVIARADKGIIGYDGSATFATALKMKGGRFADLTTAAIQNPHNAWLLSGVVFENAAGGAPAGIIGSASFPTLGLTLDACSTWDASTAGVWIDFYGDGLCVLGGFYSLATGITYLRLNGIVNGAKSIGATIVGPSGATYLATANSPDVRDAILADTFINGVADNSASVSGVRFANPMLNSRHTQRSITANTALGLSDLGKTVLVDATGGAVTVTMPDPALAGATGARVTVKKTDNGANAVSVNPVSGATMDGTFGLTIAGGARGYYTLECDGTAWWAVAHA